jgi:hypothetical protein
LAPPEDIVKAPHSYTGKFLALVPAKAGRGSAGRARRPSSTNWCKMERHDFFKLLAGVNETLAGDYKRIRRRSSEDPGTAGDQAEEDLAELFRNWLPATYPVITKGRILFEDGTSSPQVDVLVLKPSYPLGLRHEKYILAGGVVAAFECKLTLRKEHVDRAFRVAAEIKRKTRQLKGTPYDELNSRPIFGLLAHSHSLGGKRASWKIYEIVEQYQTEHIAHPRELLDLICVADAATIPLAKHVLIGSDLDRDEIETLKEAKGKNLISTMYVINNEDKNNPHDVGAILATLIHELTYRMALEDPSIRDWADHLSHIGMYGGIGRPVFWTEDELSPRVRQRLKQTSRENDRWSKWSKHLP